MDGEHNGVRKARVFPVERHVDEDVVPILRHAGQRFFEAVASRGAADCRLVCFAVRFLPLGRLVKTSPLAVRPDISYFETTNLPVTLSR